jgi:uncharacterized membrane protein HdeD (DUF308 family)
MAEIAQKEHGTAQSKSNSIVNLILSIVLLIIGIALLANPATGMEVIMLIVGIVMIVYGAITCISNAAKGVKGASFYIWPVVMMIAGILLIIFRGPAANILLPLIVGIWAIVNGIMNLTKSIKVKNSGGYWQASLILSIITLALGVIMLISMIAGGNAVGVILGVILIIFAVVSIIQWFIERAAMRSV